MNRKNRNIALAIVAGFAFAQSAAATPEFYGPRNTIPRVPYVQPKTPSCGLVLEESRTAGPRPRYVVVKDLGPCPKEKQPIRWAGPRGTIPIYEQN